jgi:hypothetical protein
MMVLFSVIPGLLLLGLLGLAVVKSIIAIVRVLSPEKSLKHPRCGACAYDVGGLPTWTCPECGRDLRRVGVHGTHQRRTPFSRCLSEGIAAVTVLCLLGFIAGVAVFGGLLGLTTWRGRSSDLYWQVPLVLAVVLWVGGSILIWLLNRRAARRHREELLRPVATQTPPQSAAASAAPPLEFPPIPSSDSGTG